MTRPWRILSLDGGGTWALIEALALARIYPGLTGREVLGQFDCAIGNSGGAIVLAALLADMVPNDIADLFLDPDSRALLYVPVRGIERAMSVLGLGPSWSAAGKLAGLRHMLGAAADRPISEVAGDLHVMMPTLRLSDERARFFSNRTGDERYIDAPLALACHASSSAPVAYFDGPATVGGETFWDGGLAGFNNPVLEAIMAAPVSPHQIAGLSIGSGCTRRPSIALRQHGEPPALFARPAGSTVLDGIRCLTRLTIADPPAEAARYSRLLTQNGILRLNPVVGPVRDGQRWTLPAGYERMGQERSDTPLEAFARLVRLDMDATEENDVRLIEDLAAAWLDGLVPNETEDGDPPWRADARQVCDVWLQRKPSMQADLRSD